MRGYDLQKFREDGARLLAERAWRRRSELGLARPDVTERGGPSADRVNAIEHARKRTYDGHVLTNLERALSWEPGSVDRIVQGGEPTVRPGTEVALAEPDPVAVDDPERRPSEDALYHMMMTMGRIYGRSVIMNLAARAVDDLSTEGEH